MSFDFTPFFAANLPPAAARWAGWAKYNFTFGNNDPDGIAIDDLKAAAEAALTREGRRLADYRMLSGPLQGLDLVNAALTERGDTVICERDCYEGTLNRYARRGVGVAGIPVDKGGMRMEALEQALEELKQKGVRPKFIYTIATVQNPTGT